MVTVGIGNNQFRTCLDEFWNSPQRKALQEKYLQEKRFEKTDTAQQQQFSADVFQKLLEQQSQRGVLQKLLEQQLQRPTVHFSPGAVASGAVASGAVASGGNLVIGGVVNNHQPASSTPAPAASSNEESGTPSI